MGLKNAPIGFGHEPTKGKANEGIRNEGRDKGKGVGAGWRGNVELGVHHINEVLALVVELVTGAIGLGASLQGENRFTI